MGTTQTLQVMGSLARAAASSVRFQALAQEFQQYPSESAMLSILDRWLRGHFRYRPEFEEVVRTPDFMLDELERTGRFEGDCDDVSTFYATILKSLHFRVRYVAIRYDASPDFKHVFVEFWSGAWRRVDPTVQANLVHQETERMVENV